MSDTTNTTGLLTRLHARLVRQLEADAVLGDMEHSLRGAAEIKAFADAIAALSPPALDAPAVGYSGLTEAQELRDVLLRNGFIECDIAACMCGSWHHRYGIRERMNEITDELRDAGVLNNSTGNLPLNAIKKLRKDAERWRWLADESYSQSADCEADLVALARKLADTHGAESDAIIDAAIEAAFAHPKAAPCDAQGAE